MDYGTIPLKVPIIGANFDSNLWVSNVDKYKVVKFPHVFSIWDLPKGFERRLNWFTAFRTFIHKF